MPFIKCTFNGKNDNLDSLIQGLSSTIANVMGKRIEVVMCQVDHKENLCFGGSKDPCAMIQIESIGGEFEPLIEPLTEVVTSNTNIPKARVFLNFRNVSAEHWGRNGMSVAAGRAAAAAAAAQS